jgi:dihydrofolate synthase/folylpolyglutamate synthase
MLATKDSEGFLRNFSGLARRLIAIPIDNEKTLPASGVAFTADHVGIPSDTAANVTEALAKVSALDLPAPPRILITGSLYLAGEILAANGTPPG